MNVLILEDEPQAAQRLETLVKQLEPGVHIEDKIDTVKRAVAWIVSHPLPDLIFMDIQLADGISFEIFEQCNIYCPVIFTTAYDQYALQAFKVNSIDYILKPVDKDELAAALRKYHSWDGPRPRIRLHHLEEAVQQLTKRYKTRFVIKVGEHLKSVEVADILFFVSLEKATFCYTRDGRKHIVDFTLDQLVGLLDPALFFRINRKYMVTVAAIGDMVSYTNSRLKLVLRNAEDPAVIVARERVQDFKEWLDR